jgi:hypothetical protein
MHAKIEELSAKAWTDVLNDPDRYRDTTTKLYDQRFAELIIKECLHVMGKYNSVVYAGDGIKEHFGVGNE